MNIKYERSNIVIDVIGIDIEWYIWNPDFDFISLLEDLKPYAVSQHSTRLVLL
jgi:hypothetical protein